jgi:Protein of unknown function (DUF1682)
VLCVSFNFSVFDRVFVHLFEIFQLLQIKAKAVANRQKTLETLQKAAHTQRSEAAQNRREEKRRAEKEKIMNEDDPEKQRKLEVQKVLNI